MTISKTIDQELFDHLVVLSIGLGFNTHTALPREDVPYPFVTVGETQLIPRRTSSRLLGKLHGTVHIFGTNRREVSDIANKLLVSTRVIELSSRQLKQVVNASDSRIMEDNSTDSILYHGVVELEFNIL